ERAGMSPRNFARRYRETRKRSPARAVESIRVDAARRALEETDDRIEDIARRCGFAREEHLRAAFARHVGIPPRAYRDRFAVACARESASKHFPTSAPPAYELSCTHEAWAARGHVSATRRLCSWPSRGDGRFHPRARGRCL